MTTTTRLTADGNRNVYGQHGEVVATVNVTRSTWLGSLLAECPRNHIYVLPSDVAEWATAEGVCPRCRVLGHV